MADANQLKYLQNMAAGKTATGGVANTGQQKWAQAQLANTPQNNNAYVSAVNNVKNAVTSQQPTQPIQQQITTPTSRANQTLSSINDQTNQKYQFKAPDPFTYNQDNDPAYHAALASARANIAQNQSDTNAYLRSNGQGKSSYSETVANQIGAKEMGRVSTDVLPQLISQAYQRYADESNRNLAVQQANYGATQDRISNLANLYSMQNNEDFNNPMTEAQLTGQYLSGEARQYINAINELKAQAETKGISADQRSALSQQADAYRAALQGLGIDSSQFGANINRTTSMQNANQVGITTLAKQNQDYAQQADQRNYDRDVLVSDRNFEFQKAQQEWQNLFNQAQFDESKAARLWQQAFNEKSFAQSVKDAAASRGLQWASLNQRDKEFIADEAFRQKQFNYGVEQDKIANDLAASKASASKYSYQTDPSFAISIKELNSDPAGAMKELSDNPDAFIKQYGYDGYNELLKKAQEATKGSSNSLDALLNR